MVGGTHSPQKANSVNKREGGCNTARYSYPPKPLLGHARDHRLATRGHADPLPAGTDVLRRAQPPTPDRISRPHSTGRTALTILTAKRSTATRARQPHVPQNTARYGARQAGRQTRARAPHHRAGTAPWGSHGEHGDAPRGTDGALPPTGGVHMNGTGETGRTATEHREVPDDGLCMQRCQGGAGKRAPNLKNFLQRSNHLSLLFFPTVGGRCTVKTYRAGPTQLAPTNRATSRAPARNKLDCASTRCSAKEPTQNKATKRRLTRPRTNKTTAADTT